MHLTKGEGPQGTPKTKQTNVSWAPIVQGSLGVPSWRGFPSSRAPVCTRARGPTGQRAHLGRSRADWPQCPLGQLAEMDPGRASALDLSQKLELPGGRRWPHPVLTGARSK